MKKALVLGIGIGVIAGTAALLAMHMLAFYQHPEFFVK